MVTPAPAAFLMLLHTPSRPLEPAAAPVAPVPPRALTPDSPLWAWAAGAIVQRAREMMSHLEGVRAGEDIEAVHDMRVWSRRLAAAMRVFEASFPTAGFRSLQREARRVTRRLGAVRDLDVLLDYYRRLASRVGADEAPAVGYLVALRERERRRARPPMLDALNRLAASHFPERLERHLRREAEAYTVGLDPESTGGLPARVRRAAPVSGRQSFRSAAVVLLGPRLEAFLAYAPYVHQEEAATQLHEMRIAAKWLRYTMELFAPAFSDALKEPLAGARRFQELLGELHDADVRLWILAETRRAPLDARGLEALGLLLPEIVTRGLAPLEVREQAVRRECYTAFVKTWNRQEKRGFAARWAGRFQEPDA